MSCVAWTFIFPTFCWFLIPTRSRRFPWIAPSCLPYAYRAITLGSPFFVKQTRVQTLSRRAALSSRQGPRISVGHVSFGLRRGCFAIGEESLRGPISSGRSITPDDHCRAWQGYARRGPLNGQKGSWGGRG